MLRTFALIPLLICLMWYEAFGQGRHQAGGAAHTYLGFDRNVYPGDESLAKLRETFSFAGYWLNNPPGEASNGWRGKRQLIEAHGFGFLVLFNGKRYAELRSPADPVILGKADAQAAAQAAHAEGFQKNTIIFLDIEEGGRLLPEQHAYLHAWIDELTAHGYRAGVYCSGITVVEPGGVKITSADDIRAHAEGRRITFWVSNDVCPPAPGCSFPRTPPLPALSGSSFAKVWQFAQSPRRKQFHQRVRSNL
jgi:Domain of unknown function (DUF1906)